MKLPSIAIAAVYASSKATAINPGDGGLRQAAAATSDANKSGVGSTLAAMFKSGVNYKPSNRYDTSSVYIMTNADDGNSVQMYGRDQENGMLEYLASFATGGLGGSTSGPPPGSLSGGGDPLGSGADSLVTVGNCLLASNPGSDTVTSFSIESKGILARKGIYDSRGNLPMSIGYKKYGYWYLVYILNAGGEGTLAGFRLNGFSCGMDFIPGSEVSLGQQNTRDPPLVVASPGQVVFVPDAEWLVVSIKGMDGVPGKGTISSYPVQSNGMLGSPSVTESKGFVPFAIEFDDAGNLLSVEAGGTEFPPAATSSAITSYKFDGSDMSLEVVQQVGIQNEAGCWFRHFNGCVVTSNGGGITAPSISTLRVDDGALTLLESRADEVNNPIDLSFSMDGKYIYILAGDVGGSPGIYVYEVDGCDLARIQVMTTGVPELNATVNGVVGLAVYN